MEGVGVPRHTRATRESVQRAVTAATSAAAGVSPGKHDGTMCDAKPDGTTVHGAIDDDACVSTDANDAATANDAAAADDGASTAYDGTNGTIVPNGTAAAIRLAANAAVGPSTVVCWIQNGSTHGEELLTVRGRRTGSFKQ